MKQLLVFLLFSSLFCWLMFSPVYKHVLVLRQALLQQEADYLLEVGASGRFGYIDAGLIEESKSRLAESGFEPARLQYSVASTSGAEADNAEQPLVRGEGIKLTIRYPYDGLLNIDRLIGLEPSATEPYLSAGGMKMSEYVP